MAVRLTLDHLHSHAIVSISPPNTVPDRCLRWVPQVALRRSARGIAMHRLLLLFLALFGCLLASVGFAAQLRVHGRVFHHDSSRPMGQVQVKVYRNGERLPSTYTSENGNYALLLDERADYVLRFTHPGMVSKCFTVDAKGPAWENDRKVVDLEVEIRLFEPVEGLDLSWFDMPMGMARFTPMTGHLAWNADYEERVRPMVDKLMAERAQRLQGLLAGQRRSFVADDRF